MKKFIPSNDQFAQKYDEAHSDNYFYKHKRGLGRKLSNWRELRIATLALQSAGKPQKVLDIPCGAGRFWPLLVGSKSCQLLAADNSEHMLSVAKKYADSNLLNQIKIFQTSAYHINMPDNSVDNIFCMRLIHHIGDRNSRLKILNEFYRVTNDTVCISLWVDGNYKAYRRKKIEENRKKKPKSYKNRYVFSEKNIENEFLESGFKIISKHDLMKYYSMWRIYTLKKDVKPIVTS